jgi:hypothetical protein
MNPLVDELVGLRIKFSCGFIRMTGLSQGYLVSIRQIWLIKYG